MFKRFISLFARTNMCKKKINNLIDANDPTRTLASDSYVNKLIKSDNNVSVGNFFLVACTIVGLLLLTVPLFALVIEAWFNHTITTELNGMASYIVAVCSIFTVGGLTHGWTHWAENKFKSVNKDSEGNELIPEDDIIKPKDEEEEQ